MTVSYTKPKQYNEIKAALIARPLATREEVAQRLRCSISTVIRVDKILKQEGVDVAAIAQGIVDKYFADHPGATCTAAALALKTTERNIGRFRHCWAGSDDDDFYNRRVLRPAWYVCEIAKRGYIGVSLPPDEFRTYLDFYNKKKKGLLS